MKLSDMLLANAMMGESGGGGGGGGGDTGTKWHVAISSVPVSDNMLSANCVQKQSEETGIIMAVLPYVDNLPYYGYEVSLESGYDNTVTFDVTDAYVLGEDEGVRIRFYYDASVTVNVTGDITCTHDEWDYRCEITGDGTITIS